jgi:hypothetical protein
MVFLVSGYWNNPELRRGSDDFIENNAAFLKYSTHLEI